MPPNNKPSNQPNPLQTTDTSLERASETPQKQNVSNEPRYLSFENIISQSGKETPEDLQAGIRLLRTYQSDVAEALKSDGGSLAKMAIAENERKDREREEMTKRLMHSGTPEVSSTPSLNAQIVIKPTEQVKKISTPETRNPESIATILKPEPIQDKPVQPIPKSAEERISSFSNPELGGETPRSQSSGRIGSIPEVKKSHFVLPLVLSLFFFFVGMGALYFVYSKSRTPIQVPVEVLPVTFSNFQSKVLTDGFTRNELLQAINTLKTSSVYTAQSLVNVVLVETDPIPTKEGRERERLIETSGLFSLMATRATPSLIRSLSPEFVLGLHIIKNGEPFLILKTEFYDATFSGLLAWEKTMAPDLLGLFTKAKTQVGTSTLVGDKVGDWVDTFQDKVVKNKDVRVLKDGAGNTILLYSFINKETLVLTTNEETFNEVYDRLTVSSFKR